MLANTHILVVEDSPTQALQLRHLLLRNFTRVTIAEHGEAALEVMHADRPDIVISDVNMPGMGGYELCGRIKASAALASIPLILITSLIDLADVVKGLECGASGFLSKPYDAEQILARIRFLLANPELHSPHAAEPAVEIQFGGERYFIASQRDQVLSFLLSTYELALSKNRELRAATDALRAQASELERSNQELEQFAYIASHDLHEPLRMVASYLGLLQRRVAERLEPKEQEYINYAVDGAQRMQQMITDLFTYSRVTTHAKAFAQADLGAVLQNALANLEVAIGERGAKITHAEMPAAQVDSTQFTQLFQNLIGNAVKFCETDAPSVSIECERDGVGWIFSVTDNGIGIEEKEFERIFQLFHRLHSRAEYPGSGIGLAVCKKIVERHGGRIWVKSEVGKGTAFFFSLPEHAAQTSV